MVIVPATFAENPDDNRTMEVNTDENVMGDMNDYYFNASLDNDDGDGSPDNPYKYLTSDRIKNSSTIHLASGEYDLDRECEIDKVNIVGEDSSNTIIKYGWWAFQVNDHLSLTNLTLDNVAILNYGSVDAKNTIFSNCDRVERSSKDIAGGAIHSYEYSKLTLTNCTFENNIATWGGAIYIDGGVLEVYNSTFISNYAYANGGAISCEYCDNVTISKSKFIKNNAPDEAGGAVHIESAYIFKISDSIFRDNSALYGGAVWIRDADVEISNSDFMNNSAYNFGGALSLQDSWFVKLYNSNFDDNWAFEDAGAAIYIISSKCFMAENINITDSHACYGAAITSLNTTTYIDNLNAKNNVAEYVGGAIYQMYCDLILTNSSFINNTALNGGALFIDNSTAFYINGNSFINNTALLSAGAIYSLFNNILSNISDDNHGLNEGDVFEINELSFKFGDGDYTLYRLNETEITDLPSSYSMLEEGYLTPVKDQGDAGNCWAFTAMAVLESCIKKITGEVYDFSEENMKNLMAFFSDYGWNQKTNDGGFESMAHGYLTSWMGPVNDSDDIYNEYSVLSPILKSLVHVQNILFLSRDSYTDNDNVKKAIMKYGAVGSSLAYYKSFLKNASYYFNLEGYGSNHAVTIVGWDDNYSKYNFNSIPEGDGAWLVKNSWGPEWGDDGYFYVSYYDRTLMKPGVYNKGYTFILNDTMRFDKNYQYDMGFKGLTYITSNLLYKNIFTATDDEMLVAVSTYFTDKTDWTVSVYVNGILKTTKSGFSIPGYWTILLDDSIHLNKGDVFEVLFNVTVEGNVTVPVSYNDYLNKPVLENITWFRTEDFTWWSNNGTVACIKAFTVVDDIKTTMTLNAVYDGFNPVNITAHVMDEYGNPLKGKVVFNLNGRNVVCDLINGEASIVENFEKGFNTVSCNFTQYGYAEAFNQTTFEVSKRPTGLSLDIVRKFKSLFVNITSADNLNDTVVLYVNNDDYTVNLVNGFAAYNLTDLDNGNYVVKAVLISPIWEADEYSTTVEINIKNTQIIAGDFTTNDDAGDNFTFTLVDEDGKPVAAKTIIVDNGTVLTNDDGVASLPITYQRGKHLITMTFEGDNDYFATSATCNITVMTNIEAEIHIDTCLSDANVTVEFSKAIDEIIALTINDNYTVHNINNGIFNITLKNLSNGLYNVSVDLLNDYFNFTQVKSDFTIMAFHTLIIADDLTVNDETESYYTVRLVDENQNPLSNRTIIINNQPVSTDADGFASIPVSYPRGKYPVSISFEGDETYFASSEDKTIHVKTNVDAQISVNVKQDSAEITVEFSKAIDENISLKINDNANVYKLNQGRFSIALKGLPSDSYSVSVDLLNDDFNFTQAKSDFIIDVKNTRIIVDEQTVYYHSGALLCICLVDENNLPLAGKTLNFTLMGENYSNITDDDGMIFIDSMNMPISSYGIAVSFTGDNNYFESKNSATLNVVSSIALPQGKFTLNSPYTVTFYGKEGPLSQTPVTITLNGVAHNLMTDSNGQATLNIDLGVGSYSASITNPQTGEVKSHFIQVTARLTGGADIVMYYGAGKSYTVRAFSDNGQPAGAGETVTFKVGGKTVYVKTDKNGYAAYKPALKPGKYTLTATYKGFSITNKITVKSTLITKDKKAKKGKKIKYEAKLLNTNGKALKGKKITFKIKGKTYNAKTNKKGIAKITIKGLKVGKYKITAKYAKLTSTSKITVKK